MSKLVYHRKGESVHGGDCLNCWEFKNCGREKGGLMADVLGECPVSTTYRLDGSNNGKGGGRACWMVPDSACRTKSSCRARRVQCHQCDFYRRVLFAEGDEIQHPFAVS